MKNTMRRIAAIALALVLVMALTACGGDKKSGYTAKNTEYVLGMSGPLTGGASIYGIAVKNAAEMAVEEINAAGGINGTKIKFVATDDMHDATKVATNYASLLEGGMQFSLGCVTTAPGLEFKNLSLEDNVFFLTPSASGDDIPKNPNGFQMCFADGNQGAVAADYVNRNLAGETIGIFYKSDDAYSSGIYTQFKANLDPSITTIDTVFTDANTTDFSSQIETLKGCTFIFMPIYYTPASLFMLQAKGTVDNKAIYYGCDGLDGIDSADGFDITTIPQEVSMLSHFNSKAEDGAAKEFIDKYVARFGGETLNQFGASSYDSVYAMVEAIKKAQSEGEKLTVTSSASDFCEALKKQFNGGFSYSGVTGDNISWDSTGYVKKTAIKYIIKAAD